MKTDAQTTDSCWVGVDLGGTKMRAAVYDATFQVQGRDMKRHKGAMTAKVGVANLTALIEKALTPEKAPKKPKLPSAIGIACPGPVNPASGLVYELVNLGWHKLAIGPRLARHFKCPVFLLNDVDAGTYGEYRFGAGQGAECLLGVFPGTGVGGGCVRNGQLMQAASVSCFEIGHLPVLPDGPLCGCGQRGCLETVAGRLAISQAAAAAVYRGAAPNLAKTAGTDLKTIRSGALARAITDGDKTIEAIVRDAARWIGVGIAGVVNLLAPDVIVLGGGLVEAMPELYLAEVEHTVRGRVMRTFRNHFRVACAALGDDAAVQGAAAWAERGLRGAQG